MRGLRHADWLSARSMAVVVVWVSGVVTLSVLLSSAFPVLLLTLAIVALTYVYARNGSAHSGILPGAAAGAGSDVETGLPPTEVAEHFVAKEFAAAQRGRNVTLVMFGFSQFDDFAEREGARASAEALREVGRVLQRLTRQMNLSARYGWRADAFLSVLSDADAAAAEIFIARVRKGLAESSIPMPEIEAGIAMYQPHLATPTEFVESAERALAAARAETFNGGNRSGGGAAGANGSSAPGGADGTGSRGYVANGAGKAERRLQAL